MPESTRLYRIKVLETFLNAGVTLQKIDAFRDVFETHGYSLSDSSNLRKLIPFILESEKNQLKESIAGKQVSVIFDGTTHVCKALVILRHDDDYCVIQQKVCRLMLLAKLLDS